MSANTKKDDPVQLMTPVAQVAEIQELLVLHASMKRIAEIVFPLRVKDHVQTTSRISRDASTVVALISLGMSAHVEGSDDNARAEATCDSDASIELSSEYQLTYQVPGISEFSDEQLDAFGCINGLYHAWPYWREYVQASIARMSLPPFTLPVLTVAELQTMEKTPKGAFSMRATPNESE